MPDLTPLTDKEKMYYRIFETYRMLHMRSGIKLMSIKAAIRLGDIVDANIGVTSASHLKIRLAAAEKKLHALKQLPGTQAARVQSGKRMYDALNKVIKNSETDADT